MSQISAVRQPYMIHIIKYILPQPVTLDGSKGLTLPVGSPGRCMTLMGKQRYLQLGKEIKKGTSSKITGLYSQRYSHLLSKCAPCLQATSQGPSKATSLESHHFAVLKTT